MQPQSHIQDQPLSIQRRPLDVEDYIDIMRRHRSYLLGPAFLGLVAGFVTAFFWPDSYLASGTIRVTPPQVSQHLVQTNTSEEMTQRIAGIYQQIISRQSLTNLIQSHNLYPDDRKRYPMEDVIETMRRDIRMTALRDLNTGPAYGRQNRGAAFGISYSYSDRRLAQRICQDIISRFIDESTRSRSTQSLMATEFFKSQVEQTRRDLDDVDQKIAEFKTKNAAGMPEQVQMMLTRINGLENAVQVTNVMISRVQQDKLLLETQLRVLKDQLPAASAGAPQSASETPGANSGPGSGANRLALVEREIRSLEDQLAGLRESYRENHPDVQRVLGYLNVKQRQKDQILQEVETERADTPAKAARPSGQSREQRQAAAAIAQLETAIRSKDMEMERLSKAMEDARARARTLQGMMEGSPAAQQAYLQLLRDRAMVDKRLQELTEKLQQSSLSSDLESRKQGENLEILEQPVMPVEPYAPKRPLIIFGGLGIGIALGITFAAGREFKDTSLKNLKDVRAYTRLTVLGSIPFLENDFVVRRRRRMAWLAWSGAFLLGVLMMAGSAIYYYTSKA
jgi:polysaccharide chain length determinant protein (PEP-CTERM system associated)